MDDERLHFLELPSDDDVWEANATNAGGLESNKHFEGTSLEWIGRGTEALPQVARQVREESKNNVDLQVPVRDLRIAPTPADERSKVRHTPVTLSVPQDHPLFQSFPGWPATVPAVEQLGTRCDVPTAVTHYHAEHDEHDMLAQSMQNALDRRQARRDRHFLIRGKRTDGGTTVRAVLSDIYGTYDNADLLDAMDEIFSTQQINARVSHMSNDGDRLQANILLPDTMRAISTVIDPATDSAYVAGLALRNDERGRGSISVWPWLCRWICRNGSIHGYQELGAQLRQRHVGKINKRVVAAKIADCVNEAIPLAHEIVMNIQRIKEVEIPDVRAAIASLCKDNNLTRPQAADWARGYQAETTALPNLTGSAFALVQGLTRAAQEWVPEAQRNAEILSGRIMAPKDPGDAEFKRHWDNIRTRARTLEADEIKQYVRVLV